MRIYKVFEADYNKDDENLISDILFLYFLENFEMREEKMSLVYNSNVTKTSVYGYKYNPYRKSYEITIKVMEKDLLKFNIEKDLLKERLRKFGFDITDFTKPHHDHSSANNISTGSTMYYLELFKNI